MKEAALKPPSKSAAPGQYLGFSLQQVRFCYYLLKVSDGAFVSLEYQDDVAIKWPDGSYHLEQAKSALKTNPASDRAVDLWKTFATWASQCADDLDPTTTTFSLYITPKKIGQLVTRLSAAASNDSISSALDEIKSLVNPKKPDAGCNPHVTSFLSVGDDICSQIISKFAIVTEEDPIECIRERLRPFIPTETLDDFCAYAIGMARDEAEKLMRIGKPAIISAKLFRNRFRAFVRKHDLLGLLISKSPGPTREAILKLLDTRPIFVRQLEAVEASREMLVTAVSDYLRTEADKVQWADEGTIVDESFNELHRQLERRHTICRDEIEDTMLLQTEEQRGRALYRRCAETNIPLDGHVLPLHFVPGTYNYLANIPRLGWHPKYKTLFPVD